MMYRVNEIFESVQGEASFTGTPSVFIRMQGCPVACPWCDTKHTWSISGPVIPIENMLQKDADSPYHSQMTEEQLFAEVNLFASQHVVITGGEPCLYDLRPLTSLLIANGYSVQIETSGTHEIKCHEDTFVTVSPKITMPGGFEIRPDALERANEIKHPIGKPADYHSLAKFVIPYLRSDQKVWLQPLSQSPKATKLCLDYARTYNHRVSIQTHKFIGVR